MHLKPLRKHTEWSWLVGVVGLALLAGACSSTPEADPALLDPAQAEDCPQLVEVAVAMVENAQDEQDGLSAEEFDSLRGVLYADLGTVAGRASELGCANVASRVFRRALGNLSTEMDRDGELILDAATFDPFRDDAAIERNREPSLLVTDYRTGLTEIEALAESLAAGYDNDGTNPVDWVDIDSDFGVALYVKWIADPDWLPSGAMSLEIPVLVLADHGALNRDDIPIPGTADVFDWVLEIPGGDKDFDALASNVNTMIKRGAFAQFDEQD